MAYDEHDTRWSPAWVVMWVVNMLALVGLELYGVAPVTWGSAFLALFLAPELVALRRHKDALPPLTYVVRRYVPRWIPTAVSFGIGTWLAVAWWPRVSHPLLVVIGIASFVGWLTNHWDVTYSE